MSGSIVMLSAAKHLAAQRDRPFAEFTLSEANGLRVTVTGILSKYLEIGCKPGQIALFFMYCSFWWED